MNVPVWLEGLCSTAWVGTSGLWLDPSQPKAASSTTAEVELVAGGNAASIRYDWAFEGTTHEGILIVGARDNGEAEASWLDSFHMSDSFMVSKGRLGDGDNLSVLGSFAAPDGQDWGWRTEIAKLSSASWRIQMFIITPTGEEALGFELDYATV
jgi:hypothetical protein